MFQPIQVSRRNTGIRLQPLPNSVVKIPLFDNSGYVNPALQEVKVHPAKLSSMQSHRSRVFARQEERLPRVDYNQANTSIARVSRVEREPQPLGAAHDVKGPRIQRPISLFSAPQPAGKTTNNRLPAVQQSLKSNRSVSKASHKTSRGQNDSTLVVGQVAGISSKEYEAQILRTEKMASGWAEARAGHAIPNLRETTDNDKSPRDQSPGRSTTDHTDAVDGKQSEKRVSKENLSKKPSDETESISSADKPTSKKAYKPTKKMPQTTNVKSKISSGYGSMSSHSQHENQTANNRYSIFKQSTGNDTAVGSAKTKELANIYNNKVKVEDNRQVVGTNGSDQEHILTGREANMYVHIKSTYKKTAERDREKRKEIFFKKLQDVQIDSALEHNKQLQVKAVKKEETKKRQLEQLQHIRDKFEEQRLTRYKSQYVTKNFLDYEGINRGEYGLPERYMKQTEYQAKLRRVGGSKVTAREFLKREVKLKKTFHKMFAEPSSINKLSTDDPKMEGKDQITLEVFDAEGKPLKGKKVDVKTEIEEAQNMIKDFENEEPDTPTKVVSKERVPTQKQVTAQSPGKPVNKKTVAGTSQSNTTSPPKAGRVNKSSNQPNSSKSSVYSTTKTDNPKPVVETPAPTTAKVSLKPPTEPTYGSTGIITNKKSADALSMNSRISAITEESEVAEDFYEQLMAKYGIELSDDDDDD